MLRRLINRVTGVTRRRRVNAGRAAPGRSSGFGSRRQRYGDLRSAFGLSTG